MNTTIRPAISDDSLAIAGVISRAFADHGRKLSAPMPLADPDVAHRLVNQRLASDGYFCVVAEQNAAVMGVNFLDERNSISGVTALAVDPASQEAGVGRLLMGAVVDRATSQNARGVRLVTAAGNPKSLVLYSKSGFAVRGTMAVVSGKPSAHLSKEHEVRPATRDDLAECDVLCDSVHGHDRSGELSDAIGAGTATVAIKGGRVTGYSSSIGSMGHCVGETNADLIALITSADGFSGRGPLVPADNTELLLWCLEHGMRVQHQVMLMSQGFYIPPSTGAYLPSMTY